MSITSQIKPNSRPCTSFAAMKPSINFVHSGQNYSKRRGELIVRNNAFGDFNNIQNICPSTNFASTEPSFFTRPTTHSTTKKFKHKITCQVTPNGTLRRKLKTQSHLENDESIFVISYISIKSTNG